MAYRFGGRDIKTDAEGYLTDPGDWSPELMRHIASEINQELGEDQILVVNMVREYYREYATTPAMRALIALLKKKNVKHLCSSAALARLFPQGAAKTASKLAGLPKPVKCT